MQNITPDSSSVTSRPTESELDHKLAELVNWQRFATHLPDLTAGDIEQIKLDNNSNVAQQKLGLYRKWLQTSTKASWEYVITALEKAKENVLADEIKMKFNAVSSCSSLLPNFSGATEAQFPSSQGIYLTSEEIVVEELKKLHRSFTTLAKDVRCKLDELVKSGTSSVHDIAVFIQEARVCGIKGLTGMETIDELFEAILPHNDYLDCELLEMIVEEYLDRNDITKVKTHINKVKLFKRTTPIKTLKDKLHQYTSIPNISDMHLIVTIKLQADWGRVTLESIEKLVHNLLDYRQTARIFKVESGSISVMLLLPKEKLQHFIVSSSQKLQFMHLTGIFRLQIGAITIFEERENKNFSFESAFLESSQCGDDEAVRFLLDLGVNVNYGNSEGQTALILASKSGEEDVVQTLLSAGANINHKDKNGHTALMVSNTVKIFLLLQPNADINISIHKRSTPLMMACDLGYLTVVETLLRLNNDPNVQNKLGWSALIFASCNGHLQIVELLLEENADPNLCTNARCTALIFSSHNGYHQVVEILLQKGANPNIQENNGLTALMFACQKGHHHVVEVLLKKGADPDIHAGEGQTALMVASRNGHLQIVELLLEENADPNLCTNARCTALIFSSHNGYHQVVEILLQKGANPNIQENNGLTALMFACQKGHHQVVEVLLKKGADPDIHAGKGQTALMVASSKGHLPVVEQLLNENADPNIHNNEGWTALIGASQNGHVQIAELLLRKKADSNACDNQGHTALMFASLNGHLQLSELLLRENADPNVCSSTGWTPLLLASKNGHSNVIEILLQYKANPHFEIRKDLDSFTIATVIGKTDIVKTFLNCSEIRFESLSMGWYYACQLGHVPIITLLSNRVDTVSNHTDLIISCAEGDSGTVVNQLISGKMTPDVQFIHGITPLMISSSCGHIDVVGALIQSGANVNKTDEFGGTALDYAEVAKQDTTQVLLLQYDGLHGIDLDSKVREFLLASVDDISIEKNISNVQSPRSSRKQRSLNISSVKRYLEDTYLTKHQSAGYTNNPLTTDFNDLNWD